LKTPNVNIIRVTKQAENISTACSAFARYTAWEKIAEAASPIQTQELKTAQGALLCTQKADMSMF